MKEIWEKIKTFLNPFYLVAAAFILGVIYGLTDWEPLGWVLGVVLIILIIGALFAIVYAWIVNPIQWLIEKNKKK